MRVVVVALCLLTLNACTSSLHGSFTKQSYAPPGARENAEPLGKVYGRDCQVNVLYFFGWGLAPQTANAVEDAMTDREGTAFLTDISIDDQVEYYFPYSRACITVDATAWR